MTWTTPKTWNTGDPLTAGDMNIHIRDNLNALKSPPTALVTKVFSTDLTLTTSSWADIDPAFNLMLNTTGGDVLVGFNLSAGNGSGGVGGFNLRVDGVDVSSDTYGILRCDNVGITAISFTWLVTSLASGSHTFKLRWRTFSGTTIIAAGVLHQFWVREVS
ncbi:MAG: hypothetical protein CUN56_08965 [Phototrophicales bacterium]|nr:MAG: hypothetical protein CUN56_08965 [Phototrophicales bacterium]RMG74702.1 MAG: hypothetical protein D6711_08180 [Chloroflexota bacterium]